MIIWLLLFIVSCAALKRVAAAAAWAPAPAMGTNTWNSIRSAINEQFVRQTIDAFVTFNLSAYGYEYVNVDDGWAQPAGPNGRYPNGTVIVDPQSFPSGIKALADYAHRNGLKFGLYTDRGTATCMGRVGSQGFERIDAQTYADWGVDYLKEDSCNAPNNHTVAFQQYGLMRDALRATARPIYFSLCGWHTWYAPVGKQLGQSWRIADDCNTWARISAAMDKNAFLGQFASRGHYNDPDMLLGSQPGTAVYLTTARSRTQFSVWCVMMAPLLIGADVRHLSAFDLETYTNAELIAVNKDPLFVQGQRVVGGNLTEGPLWLPFPVTNVWAKPLVDGSVAMVFVNNAPWSQDVTCDQACFQKVGLAGATLTPRDLWLHQNQSAFSADSGFSVSVDAWGASQSFRFIPQ